jgi:hypothetical protein
MTPREPTSELVSLREAATLLGLWDVRTCGVRSKLTGWHSSGSADEPVSSAALSPLSSMQPARLPRGRRRVVRTGMRKIVSPLANVPTVRRLCLPTHHPNVAGRPAAAGASRFRLSPASIASTVSAVPPQRGCAVNRGAHAASTATIRRASPGRRASAGSMPAT